MANELRCARRIEARALVARTSAPDCALWLIVLVTTVASPILASNKRILVGVYVVVALYYAVKGFPNANYALALYVYMTANVLALIVHFNEPESVLNAGSLIVSIFAIAAVAYRSSSGTSSELMERHLYRCFAVTFIVSIALSIVLTGVGWSSAPRSYPWHALMGADRFLLLKGDMARHSPSLWLSAFLLAYIINRFSAYRTGIVRTLVGISAIVLAIVIVRTESRLALIFLGQISALFVANCRVPFARTTLVGLPLIVSLGIVTVSLSPAATQALSNLVFRAQSVAGDSIRLAPGQDAGVSAFAGRAVLNQRLYEISHVAPIIGLGDGAEVLERGVTKAGEIAPADMEGNRPRTESILRIPVKYGWPYFLALALFSIAVPRSLIRGRVRNLNLKLTVWGMCVVTLAAQGGMEQFYGLSGLILFVMCLMYFEGLRRSKERSLARAWFDRRMMSGELGNR